MAKKRTLCIDTSSGQGEALHKVISTYAHVAYPVGGSDCSAATRQALLDIADKLLTSEAAEISARQRPMLKSAVTWYFTEVEKNESSMGELLLAQLSRKKT